MSVTSLNVGGYKQLSATANVSPLPSNLLGVFVSSSTSGTVTVYDSATTTTTAKMIDTFTAAAATYYPFNVSTASGIYVVLGGTISATFVYA
jgi:hypothetical protein